MTASAQPPVSNQDSLAMSVERVRSIQLPTSWRGYDPKVVDQVMAQLGELLDHSLADLKRVQHELTQERERRESVTQERDANDMSIVDFRRRLNETTGECENLTRSMREMVSERDELRTAVEALRGEREERVLYTLQLEQEIVRFREFEESMTQTMMLAERTANEVRGLAEREATLIIESARVKSKERLSEHSTERDRLVSDVRAIRSMLSSALAVLDEKSLNDHSKNSH
jgi:chromosome segregation ATPase